MSRQFPSDARWMLYGANGYTGRYLAKKGVAAGFTPVLAGRNSQALAKIARELNCEFRSFALVEPRRICQELAGFQLVLNCAGPFSRTAPALVEACLETRTHYLDVTGEIDVIEHLARLDSLARSRNTLLLPAVGFDVVPTDTLAVILSRALPDADRLILAFDSPGPIGPGTAKTALASLPRGGRIRRNGRITYVPLGWKSREVMFRDRRRNVMSIPWGDIASAYYSTGIRNIETYMAASPRRLRAVRAMRFFAPWLHLRTVRDLIEYRIERTTRGQSPEQIAASRAWIWGQVTNPAGESVAATLCTPGGYALTADTALLCVQTVLSGASGVRCGYATGSMVASTERVLALPGVDFRWERPGEISP